MRLHLFRHAFTERSTTGLLFIGSDFECFILEDVVREAPGFPVAEWKVKGKTAIPRGTYRVVISHSHRFQKETPELLDVPGFLGIRIHPGNTDADTEGCLLPGRTRTRDFVGQSRFAYDQLAAKLRAALDRGETIDITVE